MGSRCYSDLVDSVRFACVPGCTNCCNMKGYVYLTEQDCARAAAFLGLTRAAFLRKYVYRTKNFLRLRKPRRSQCHFLEAEGCRIHPAKPTQCRVFPFWPELIGDARSWQETAARCPGIGRGKLLPIESVFRTANEMREAYPAMYEDL